MPAVTLNNIFESVGAKVHVPGDAAREVETVVAGDLLSFIMGSDSEGAAWVTIQTHLNVAAVAVLKDIPLIIIASGREPAEDLIARCREENIAVITAAGSIYDLCLSLGKLGLKG